MSKFIKNMSYDRALEKAMRYCSYQERCVQDLEKRFYAWNVKKIDWDKELTKKKEGIKFLILKDSNVREAVDELIVCLQMRVHKGVNISKDDAVELIAIHLTTKPMFDAIVAGRNTESNELHKKINKVLSAMKQYFLQLNYPR